MSQTTIPFHKREISYDVLSGQTRFAYNFPALSKDSLHISYVEAGLTHVLDGSLYKVEGVSNATGGEIVLFTPLPSAAEKITIQGALVVERDTSLVPRGNFSAALVNNEFDRLIVMLQEMRRDLAVGLDVVGDTGEILAQINALRDSADSAYNQAVTLAQNAASSIDYTRDALIFVKDEAGATDTEKFLAALAKAALFKRAEIVCHSNLLIELQGPLILKSFTVLRGNGATIKCPVAAASPIKTEVNAQGVLIDGFIINGKSASNIIDARGVRNFTVRNCEIYNFSGRAVDVWSSLEFGICDVMIADNFFHSPTLGVGHVVLIRSGTGGLRGKNCHIINNVGLGAAADVPLEDYTVSNEFTADFLVMQGIVGGSVAGNIVRYSGSAGVSITRGSRLIRITDNHFEMCFEPGINIGSGYGQVHIHNMAAFVIGDSVVSSSANITNGTISYIRPDKELRPNGLRGAWIGIANLTGGMYGISDDVTLVSGAGSAMVNIAAAGEIEAYKSVIDSAADMTILNNHCSDTVIQFHESPAAAINIIQCRGDNIVSSNTVDNPRKIGKTDRILANANGFVGYGVNYFGLLPGLSEHYSKAGPVSLWLYQTNNIRQADAIVLSQGRVTAGGLVYNGSVNILSGTKITTGVYSIVLVEALDHYTTAVINVTAIGGVPAVLTAIAVSATSLTIRSYGLDNVLSDSPFFISVSEEIEDVYSV